jgi:hypothetical protein
LILDNISTSGNTINLAMILKAMITPGGIIQWLNILVNTLNGKIYRERKAVVDSTFQQLRLE